jgi:hypothetical protein
MNGIDPFLAHKMLENKQNELPKQPTFELLDNLKRKVEQETFTEMITFADKIKALQNNFKEAMDRTNGVISTSMNVHTKVSKKLAYKGHWILVDSKISDEDFNELKEKLK